MRGTAYAGRLESVATPDERRLVLGNRIIERLVYKSDGWSSELLRRLGRRCGKEQVREWWAVGGEV